MLQATAEMPSNQSDIIAKHPEEARRMAEWLKERVSASKKKPSAEVVTLTPVLAQLLLERNSINRPISAANEASIASDVVNGRFEFNGESIVISNTGVLLDGQHRLQTVVKSGRPIQTVIVFGPREEARYTIDTGRPKSAPNFLAMKGHRYSAMLAAAIGNVLRYRARNSLTSGGEGYNPTKVEIVDALDHLRGIEASVELAAEAPRILGAKSVIAFAHYIIAKKATREEADDFFRKIFDGVSLQRGSPILYCARRLPDVGSNGTKSGYNARAELIFKCWNAHRRGETFTKLPLNGRLPKIER